MKGLEMIDDTLIDINSPYPMSGEDICSINAGRVSSQITPR